MAPSPTEKTADALRIQLDAYKRANGCSGRKALMPVLGLTNPARMTDELNATHGNERLFEVIAKGERARVLSGSALSGYAVGVGVGTRSSVSGDQWWGPLASATGLGRPGEPDFRDANDVVLCAEAFTDYYAAAADSPASWQEMCGDRDRRAGEQLVSYLARLVAGPYGVMSKAVDLLAWLARLSPDLVADEVGVSPVTTQLIRCLDDAFDRGQVSPPLSAAFTRVLAQPPPFIGVKMYWLRALKRVVATNCDASIGWALEQLQDAVLGINAFDGSALVDRRFALWLHVDGHIPNQAWRSALKIALDDEYLADLAPAIDHLRKSPRNPKDLVNGYSDCGLDSAELMNEDYCDERTWAGYEDWRWLRPGNRKVLLRAARTTLLSPNAFEQRAALDFIRACGPIARGSVDDLTAQIYAAEEASDAPNALVLERCVRMFGAMNQPRGLGVVESLLSRWAKQDVIDDHLVQAALESARELANGNRTNAAGMQGWIDRIVSNSTSIAVNVLGVRAASAYKIRTDRFFRVLPARDELPVRQTLEWADRTLKDPWLVDAS